MCVLYYITQEEAYGYDIMQKMHTFFPEVNESTFYSILRRLHKNGEAEIYAKDISNGPARKYYRITEMGQEKLHQNINEWNELVKIIREIGIQ